LPHNIPPKTLSKICEVWKLAFGVNQVHYIFVFSFFKFKIPIRPTCQSFPFSLPAGPVCQFSPARQHPLSLGPKYQTYHSLPSHHHLSAAASLLRQRATAGTPHPCAVYGSLPDTGPLSPLSQCARQAAAPCFP
jgi:hypothetical protein